MPLPQTQIESYPPLFRPPKYSDSDPKEDNMDGDGTTSSPEDTLPLIDMQCLELNKLDRACRDWGIFRLINHGVPPILLSQLKDHAKHIFDLPFESKQDLTNSCPIIKYFWGTPALTPTGFALPRATGAHNFDWVEGLNLPLGQLSSHHHVQTVHHHPSINAFRNLVEDYRGHLTRLGSSLFEAMLKSLKVDAKLPRIYLDESTQLVRVYRYPCGLSVAEDNIQGMHEHTDSSLLSILNENDVGGFQFVKDEIWFDVKPIPNSLVVNLGDMMQALSDDKYKSVKHQVKLSKHKERVSICYFVFPEDNSLIESSTYKPFTYSDFRAQVQRDVKTLGCKVGLQRFKLPQPQTNLEPFHNNMD